jgi:hypothetical protein
MDHPMTRFARVVRVHLRRWRSRLPQPPPPASEPVAPLPSVPAPNEVTSAGNYKSPITCPSATALVSARNIVRKTLKHNS